MTQDELNNLLSEQKRTASNIHYISKAIIEVIESALVGEEQALEMLKTINAKDYDLIGTFLKISALLTKIFPMQHKLSDSEKMKKLSELSHEEYEKLINKSDINVLKEFVKHYDQRNN